MFYFFAGIFFLIFYFYCVYLFAESTYNACRNPNHFIDQYLIVQEVKESEQVVILHKISSYNFDSVDPMLMNGQRYNSADGLITKSPITARSTGSIGWFDNSDDDVLISDQERALVQSIINQEFETLRSGTPDITILTKTW